MAYQAMGVAIRTERPTSMINSLDKSPPETDDGGAEDLADADFFGATFCDEGGHPEQTQAADKDGEGSKETGEAADALFSTEFGVILAVGELVIKRFRRVEAFEDGLDLCDSIAGVSGGFEPDVEHRHEPGRFVVECRLDRRVGRLHDHVFDYAEDLETVAIPIQELADGGV